MIRVGHVFNEYCSPKGPWRHWIASNPYVDSAVFCMRRSNEHLSPHPQVYVDAAAERFRSFGQTPLRRLFTRPAAFVAHRLAWSHFLKTFRPDVLHVQFADKAARILPMLARAGVPLVVTCHGGDVNTAQQRDEQYLTNLQMLFQQATLLQCVSETVRESAINCGCPESKLRVVHIGCPVGEQVAVPTKRTADCVFGCVGGLVKRKGQHVLIRAFADCHRQCPRAVLHLFGDGPERTSLEALAGELGVQQAVRFHGHTDHDEVQQQMANVDVAILVSEKDQFGHGEGMPVALKEAGALGLPAIGTRCDGIPELVLHEKTGLIIEQRDQQALAAAMVRLASHPELRQRLGAAARQRISTQFNLDIQLQRLAEFYREAISVRASTVTDSNLENASGE